jgi:hypothetical protein
LRELIADVEARELTLTAVNTPDHVVSDLRKQYSDRNISITTREMPDEPNRFAILRRQNTFVTAIRLDDIYAGTIEPTDTEVGATAGDEVGGDATVDAFDEENVDLDDPTTSPATYSEPVLDHLEEALFTSYSIKQMFMASREIEDRAWRMGSGELHAGFQTVEVLSGQTETYDRLGTQTDLSVHAYAAPVGETATIPESEGFTLHVEQDDEIRRTWFVVYDGDDVDENKCALLAEERGEDEYYGFWTYDPKTVDYLQEYLKSTYGRVRSDDSTDNDSLPV